MIGIVKYYYTALFCFGLFGFGLYIYLCDLCDKFSAYIENALHGIEKEYDYIVVGAGSAGSVVAARLSEDPNVSVLVLEAGGYGGRLLDIPIVAPILHETLYDWQYDIQPQKYAYGGFNNNGNPWPAGKIVGGSGRLNMMMYTRGHPNDFKEWYKDFDGYNYERDILKYFKKSEDQMGTYLKSSQYHSSRGPLVANDPIYISEMYESVANAAIDMGFPVRDINGEFASGFSVPQVNIKNGSRSSTGHYLLQHRPRPNLTIKVFSHVEKVLFKGDYEAYAVKHKILNAVHLTRARKAIVLCAGAMGTPKLLMLSGIGNRAHLKDVGIRPKLNLPVGDNLQDHITTGFDLILLNRPLGINIYTLLSPINHFKYFFLSDGPLTSAGCEAYALLNSNCLNSTEYQLCEEKFQQPDLEVLFMPVGISSDYGVRFKDTVGFKNEVWSEYFSKLTDRFALTFLPVVLHPKSVGTLRLKDKFPTSKPIIDPNYLSNPSDVDLLIKGLRFVKKFVEHPQMQNLGATFNNLKFPGCQMFEFDSEEYWKCYVKQVSFTMYHPVGTCKMGAEGDLSSVVNYDFRVIGSNRLFVVDASVMPSLVSANINAAVVMLAEKAADVIRKYRRLEIGFCYVRDVFLKICSVY